MEFTTDLRLQLVLALAIIAILVLCFLLVMHTIGNIQHAFNRIELLIEKEAELRFEMLTHQRKLNQQREQWDKERSTRDEILMSIPGDKSSSRKKS